MEDNEIDVVDIIKVRYKKIEDALSLLGKVLEEGPAYLKDEVNEFGFRGTVLFLFQSLLDLSNALLISRDITPTSYRDLFLYLIKENIIDEKYTLLLDKIVDIRNILLFGHKAMNVEELFKFVNENLEGIREIFHSIIKLLGEI